jgi:hypothetical protein
MVKRFFHLLALAFMLQMSAGLASAYCMHETGAASEHFGHHQHEHQSAEVDQEAPTPAKKGGPDADCASCAHGTLVAPSPYTDTLQHPPAAHHEGALPPSPPAPYLGQPERPNWNRAD